MSAPSYYELGAEQRRIAIDTMQAFEAYSEALEQSHHFKGFMTWKKAKGKEYLFKGKGSRGNGRSLGLRSPETEYQYEAFTTGKEKAKKRLKASEERLRLQSRYAKVNRLEQLPKETTQILRALNKNNTQYCVIGSNALHAYESMAGIRFLREIKETRDIDPLLDARSELKISTAIPRATFLSVLQQADRTFRKSNKGFRAINDTGFMVDLVTAPQKPIIADNPFAVTLEDDLDISEIQTLEWLVNTPTTTQFVFGHDGIPVELTVPDPRAFVLHKYYVSQSPKRETIKRRRDKLQSALMAEIIPRYLQEFAFTDKSLQAFPLALRQLFVSSSDESDDERLW